MEHTSIKVVQQIFIFNSPVGLMVAAIGLYKNNLNKFA